MNERQAQALLYFLGYYSLPVRNTDIPSIDGAWGEQSVAACKRFQSDFGLQATGDLSEETAKALLHAVTYGVEKKTETQTKTDSVWDKAPNFTREEFRCTCGGKYCNGFPVEPDEKLVLLCQSVRDHYNKPFIIEPNHRGISCPTRNKEVGGVWNSRHLTGKAVDFHIPGVSGHDIVAYLKTRNDVAYTYCMKDGLSVHMDVDY